MIDDKKKNLIVLYLKEKKSDQKDKKKYNTWCMVGKIYHSKPLIWGVMSLLINPPQKTCLTYIRIKLTPIV